MAFFIFEERPVQRNLRSSHRRSPEKIGLKKMLLILHHENAFAENFKVIIKLKLLIRDFKWERL